MSSKWMNTVWDEADLLGGNELVALLAIADSADENGRYALDRFQLAQLVRTNWHDVGDILNQLQNKHYIRLSEDEYETRVYIEPITEWEKQS